VLIVEQPAHCASNLIIAFWAGLLLFLFAARRQSGLATGTARIPFRSISEPVAVNPSRS
jgi:hypothetical protein